MRWSTEGVSPVSIAALVVANLIPLFGVLFGDWSLLLLLVMYWIESGIVGAVNVAKIAMARGTEPPGRGPGSRWSPVGGANPPRLVVILFFIVHYGLFWVVHGVFVLLLPVFVGLGTTMFTAPAPGFGLTDLGTIEPRGVVIAAVGLAISHVVSFFVNYLGRGEHLTVSPAAQMFRVYGRVVVLHLTVLLGAVAAGALGAPVGVVVVFVLVKIVVDVAFHVREHRRAGTAAATAPPAVHAPGRTAPDS
ncbi:MAG TPA: DUF6498-containing protein [Euzebyales bacterium]|nr:DUF6498-containing protein [Euzebyales bacterium]